jgi:hypothetical protein
MTTRSSRNELGADHLIPDKIPALPGPAAAASNGRNESLPASELPFSAFGSITQFKDAQRMAMMLTHSSIVPENYRGEEHLGDCVIALEIANRIGASILAVMQNLHLVQGRPGWSSQFLISCVNASKRFSPLRYQMTGKRGEDNWGCVAWNIDKQGQVLKSPEVTIKMAKEEGWYDWPGSKWKTMPELMLCYRSATLFARLYAPELTMGIQTVEEVADIGPERTVRSSRPVFDSKPAKAKLAPKSQGLRQRATSSPRQPLVAVNAKPAVRPAEPAPTYNHLRALNALIALSQHSEAKVLSFLQNTRRYNPACSSLAEVADKHPKVIIWAHDNWKALERELSRQESNKAL